MSNESIYEYLNAIRDGYKKASAREKTRILDGAILATRLSRKHLIVALTGRVKPWRRDQGAVASPRMARK